MRCGNCGKELTPQDKFCSQCGKAVPPQEIFCSQCGKKLAPEDKFCSQCGTKVSAQDEPVSQAETEKAPEPSSPVKTEAGGAQASEWPDTPGSREDFLSLLATGQNLYAINERLRGVHGDATLKAVTEGTAVRYTANELFHLAALKKIDKGVRHTPEPVTLAEKRAYLLEALTVVEKQITPELQSRDSKSYATLLDKKAATLDAIKRIDDGNVSFRVIVCPHCHKWTDNDFTHCVHCYKSVNPYAPKSVPQAGQQPAPAAKTPAAPPQPAPSSPAGDPASTWPNTGCDKETLLSMLAGIRSMLTLNERMINPTSSEIVKAGVAKSDVVYTSTELIYLACIKKIDQGIRHTPEPITLSERRTYYQEALAVTEKEITPELRSSDSKRYSNLIEKKADLQAAIQKIDNGQMISRVIFCPHCHKWTDNSFTHCVHCYKRVNPAAPRPVPQAGPQPASPAAPKPAVAAASQPAPKPAVAAASQPAPKPAVAAASQPAPSHAAAQVRYADESMKNWERLPGEKSVCGRHVAGLLKPETGKYTCFMEVTDRRILLWRESAGSVTFGTVARMGGGLLGSLISAGAKAAVGAGPKPWIEIPLAAVSSCGVRNKAEFYIEADQTYVLMNPKKYDKFLPELVANAKK